MPKVAVSIYAKVRNRQLTIRATGMDLRIFGFGCTTSLKSSGLDDCMSGISGYGGVYSWCSCCPATFLFFKKIKSKKNLYIPHIQTRKADGLSEVGAMIQISL